jgi:hypothetical protein
MSSNNQGIDYKTHILLGVHADGVMEAIADWPHVPPQAEVQKEIDGTHVPYVTFALCTPTSIMPAERSAPKTQKVTPSRFGSPAPVRRP